MSQRDTLEVNRCSKDTFFFGGSTEFACEFTDNSFFSISMEFVGRIGCDEFAEKDPAGVGFRGRYLGLSFSDEASRNQKYSWKSGLVKLTAVIWRRSKGTSSCEFECLPDVL